MKEDNIVNQSEYSKLQHLLQYHQNDSSYQNAEDILFKSKNLSMQKQKKLFNQTFLQQEILNNLSTGIALLSQNCKIIQANKTLKQFLLSNFTEKQNIEEILLNFKFQNVHSISDSKEEQNTDQSIKDQRPFKKSLSLESYSFFPNKNESTEFLKSQLVNCASQNRLKPTDSNKRKIESYQNSSHQINSSPVHQFAKFQFQSLNEDSMRDNSYIRINKQQLQQQYQQLQDSPNINNLPENKIIKKSQYQIQSHNQKKVEKGQQQQSQVKTQQTETSSTQGQACKIFLNNSMVGDSMKFESFLNNSKFDPNSSMIKSKNLKWKKCFIQYDENLLSVLNKSSFTIQDIIDALLQCHVQSQRAMRSDRVLSVSQQKNNSSNIEKTLSKSKSQQQNGFIKKCYEIVDCNILLLRGKTAKGETLFKISSYTQENQVRTDFQNQISQIRRISDDIILDHEQEQESLFFHQNEEIKEILIMVELVDINNVLHEKESDILKSYKSKMLASLSHELRTPLNCSMQLIETLYFSGLLSEEDKSLFLVPAIQSNQLLLHMINDILDFAQINNGELRLVFGEFDVRKIISDCIQLFGLLSFQKGVPIELIIDPILPRTIRSDITRFKQVLLNLLSNALKYTESGQITILVEYCLSQDSNIENYLKISIQDTGCGIDPDLGSSIFDGFNCKNIPSKKQNVINSKQKVPINLKKSIKTSNLLSHSNFSENDDDFSNQFNSGGAGLGLSISQNLAKGLGSNKGISFTSQVNKGSTFTFYVTDRNKSVPGCMLNIRSLFNIQYYNWKTIDSITNNLSSQVTQSDNGQQKSLSRLKGSRQSDILGDQLNGWKRSSGMAISLGISSNIDSKQKSIANQQSKASFMVTENSLDLGQEVYSRKKKKFDELNLEPCQLQSLRKWYQDIEKQIQNSYQMIQGDTDTNRQGSSCILEENCSDDSSNDNIASLRKNPHNFTFQKSGSYLRQNNKNLFQMPTQFSSFIHSMPPINTQDLKSKSPIRYSWQSQNDLQRQSPTLKKKKTDNLSTPQKFFMFQRTNECEQNTFEQQQDMESNSLNIYPRIYNYQPESEQQQQINNESFKSLQSIYQNYGKTDKQEIPSEKKIEQRIQLKKLNNNQKDDEELNHMTSTSILFIKQESQKIQQRGQRGSESNKGNKVECTKEDNQTKNESNQDSQLLFSAKHIIKQKINTKNKCNCTNILLVDDNDFNLFALEVRLRSYDIKAEKANSGQLAIEKVQNKYKNSTCCKLYDLIFMDIDMPVKNGYQTTKEIIKFYNQEKIENPPPISACTAFVSDHEKNKAIKSGMKYYITKPVDSFKLEDVLLKIYS